jgi:O-antigen ligase
MTISDNFCGRGRIMHLSRRKTVDIWAISIMCSLLLVLPARFYNGFYLGIFAVQSNLSVYYMNLMELTIFVVACYCIIINNKLHLERFSLSFCNFYIVSNLFMLFFLYIRGKADFSGELISKSFVILSAAIICSTISQGNDLQKCAIYVIPLLFLVTASFFLAGYQAYGRMNRTGSIGFGTNETASFACILLAIGLFVENFNIWFRIGISLLSVACLFNVASRRGILIGVVIVVLKGLIWLLWKKRDALNLKKLIWTSIPIIVTAAVLYVNWGGIAEKIDRSALLTRIRFTEKRNEDILDYSNRLAIFDDAFEYFFNHILLGSNGCDLLYAQETKSHAHNLLLQILVTHGVIIGAVIICFILVTLIRAVILVSHYRKNKDSAFQVVVSLFFIIYFVFDSFGYLLWNPKGLFWIAISIILINEEYHRLKVQGIYAKPDKNY